MASPSISLPPQVLQAIAWARHYDVMNKNDPDKLDRSEMPFLAFMRGKRKHQTFIQNTLPQKVHRASGLTWETVTRKGNLHFKTPYFDDELLWSRTAKHLGVEIPHEDLINMGFNPLPNGERSGKGWVGDLKGMGKKGLELVDYINELYDEIDDAYDIQMNQELLLDGSAATGNMVGLDGLCPLDNTAGIIGGKDRSDPLYRHIVVTGSTTAAGTGTLERDLQVGVRAAENQARGMKGKIDVCFAGDDWVDAYVTYAKLNGIQFNASVESPTKIDIAIPDDGLRWRQIRIVRDPTFAKLDAAGHGGGTPWSKRAYFLTSKAWQLAYQDLDKHFSVAQDRDDLRQTRMSWDGRYCPILRAPNKQFVNTIA